MIRLKLKIRLQVQGSYVLFLIAPESLIVLLINVICSLRFISLFTQENGKECR